MSNKRNLFIVDDEPQVLSSIRRCLRNIDATIHCFESPIKAIECAEEDAPVVIITDQRMPFMKGTEMMAEIRKVLPEVNGILISAFNDLNDVTDAFNDNIIQKYLPKPWDNDELRMLVSSALNEQETSRKQESNSQSNSVGFHGIITNDQSMNKAFDYISKASKANIPVFITGETGTGKELAAKAFYQESMRSDSLFVAVNCANFSDTLMESQLFGHSKGAFTGAVRSQKGLLETAGNGVIFLDEITCLPLDLQAKLLRVLQEREFSPIGSHTTKKFHAQVISASSISLKEAVENGEFREDLYYRLNVITVNLPPLRDRGEDSLLLAEYFLKQYSKELDREVATFTEEAKEKILSYSWPGNIRQLENLIHSIVVLNDSSSVDADMLTVGIDYEPPSITAYEENNNESEGNESGDNKSEDHISEESDENTLNASVSKSIIKPLWLTEKEAIEKAINAHQGNIPQAAAALEVSPSTLYRKLQSWKH